MFSQCVFAVLTLVKYSSRSVFFKEGSVEKLEEMGLGETSARNLVDLHLKVG